MPRSNLERLIETVDPPTLKRLAEEDEEEQWMEHSLVFLPARMTRRHIMRHFDYSFEGVRYLERKHKWEPIQGGVNTSTKYFYGPDIHRDLCKCGGRLHRFKRTFSEKLEEVANG